jgi:hypothetical protein
VGFAGTLMVVQPSFAAVGAPALLPLVVAVVFSLFMLTTRAIAREVDPISLQCVSGLLASALLVPLLVLFVGSGILWLDPVLPDAREMWLLLLLGALGTAAHLLMTWSLRFAPTSTVAPMQYLEIPFATASASPCSAISRTASRSRGSASPWRPDSTSSRANRRSAGQRRRHLLQRLPRRDHEHPRPVDLEPHRPRDLVRRPDPPAGSKTIPSIGQRSPWTAP